MIRKAMPNDLDIIEEVLEDVKSRMYDDGIDQWDADYPNKDILKQDIQRQVGYVYIENNELLSYMVFNESCDKEYYLLMWKYPSPFLVIHRLFVSPLAQAKGISTKMIRFAEQYAIEHNYLSIRLDAFSLNETANTVYLKKGYEFVGTVIFRKGLFNCYEKAIN
ncbi:Acetyltransferase (GNAT) family protein [Pedobacter sp. ok626]|uniref:GNAT family N-acetyltransferase n=1 Tax=Pedobacter sp. ok626 TaxID=1761882 RepID=UPI0008837CA9|nr:GNAT family N-acetyltransferase [Pedobacter sp. ok626]SDK56477.1 Acetyltransferase (GNAT) family protein [Pedobacter sp. ok626]